MQIDVDVVMMTFQRKVSRTYILNSLTQSCIARLQLPYIAIGWCCCRLAVSCAILTVKMSRNRFAQPRAPKGTKVRENIIVGLLLGQICSERTCSMNCETVLQWASGNITDAAGIAYPSLLWHSPAARTFAEQRKRSFSDFKQSKHSV
jgi:hypothetical protein